jgi:hypothetical protein
MRFYKVSSASPSPAFRSIYMIGVYKLHVYLIPFLMSKHGEDQNFLPSCKIKLQCRGMYRTTDSRVRKEGLGDPVCP